MTIDLLWVFLAFVLGLLLAGGILVFIFFSPIRQALMLAGAIKALREGVEELTDAVGTISSAFKTIFGAVRRIIGIGKKTKKKVKKKARR